MVSTAGALQRLRAMAIQGWSVIASVWQETAIGATGGADTTSAGAVAQPATASSAMVGHTRRNVTFIDSSFSCLKSRLTV
jgi:uncharacterized membrane protein YhiD involved in acid resistance